MLDYHLYRGWDAVVVNCEKGITTENKAQQQVLGI